MARVVVIGAGMSGLAVAARLARMRHDVTVLEQADGPGGQCGRYERDGFAFDTGPTLLHLPATYRDLFTKTGKTAPLDKVLELAPLDPAVRWAFAGGPPIDVPASTRAGMTDTLTTAFGAREAAGWDAFIGEAGEIWATFRHGFNTAPDHRLRDAMRTKAGRARFKALTPHRSLAAMAKAHLREPRLRQVVDSYPLRLGVDPRKAAALVSIWPHMEQTFGTWRPRGGVAALVDAMEARATLRGATIRYRTPARRITVEGDAIRTVVLCDGSSIEADIVVAACGEHVLNELLDHYTPANYSGERGSASTFTVLLALDGAQTLAAPTISFSSDPDAEVLDIFGGRVRPPADPTLWIDQAIAPAGASAWQVQVTVPRHDDNRRAVTWTQALTAAYAQQLIDVLDRRGFEVSGRLRWHEVRTPADIEAATGRPWGSLSAHASALTGRTALFPTPNGGGPTTGLWQVGSDVHPGPGIDLVPLGSALVAESIGRAR
ncbi:MAG: phytoene desaturase family protein [Sporichthyaceae bacterium]